MKMRYLCAFSVLLLSGHLGQTATLSGRVIDESGDAVANAAVVWVGLPTL
jgi:protocatechuate 3,4-dioxygenase beta subunit